MQISNGAITQPIKPLFQFETFESELNGFPVVVEYHFDSQRWYESEGSHELAFTIMGIYPMLEDGTVANLNVMEYQLDSKAESILKEEAGDHEPI